MAKLKSTDRAAMKSWTMGCWWARPTCWSGIRDELALLAKNTEERITFTGEPEETMPEELARLSELAALEAREAVTSYSGLAS